MNYLKILFTLSFFILISSTILILFKLSAIAYDFPKGDYAGHLARIWFLDKYGFFGTVPNWYGGFTFFSHYPPLFYLISWVFYKIYQNILFSLYFSVLFTFFLGFIIFFYSRKMFGRKNEFFLLFVILFANPFTTYALITGRAPEMFSWIFFPLVFGITWNVFKKHKFEVLNFVALTSFLSVILLSHVFVYIMSVLVVFSSFLFSENKNRLLLIVSVFLSLLITSFWFYPFLKVSLNSLGGISSWGSIEYRLFPTFVYILSLFLLFKKNRKESVFFLPFLLISILLVTFLIDITPILNAPFLTTYGILLIFLSYFILVRIHTKFSEIMIITLNLIFFMINIYGLQTSKGFLLKNHPEYYQMASIVLNLPSNEKFVVLPELYVSRECSIYSFATIYKNLSTPFGQYPQIATKELTKLESELNSSFTTKNCEKVREISKLLKFNFIVSRDEFCNMCFNLTLKKDRACILSVN